MNSRSLTELAAVITGSSPEKGSTAELVQFIQIKDLDPAKRSLVCAPRPSTKRARAAQPGDVLLSARGGLAVVVGESTADDLVGAYPTLDVYLVRPDPERLDSSYLAALLNHDPVRNGLQASTTGVLIPRVPIAALKRLRVPLPPLGRQRAIGSLFRCAREEIDLLGRLLDATRQFRERQIAAAFASLEQ
jgi:hypothetical protein